jgi:hypothetical protein
VVLEYINFPVFAWEDLKIQKNQKAEQHCRAHEHGPENHPAETLGGSPSDCDDRELRTPRPHTLALRTLIACVHLNCLWVH